MSSVISNNRSYTNHAYINDNPSNGSSFRDKEQRTKTGANPVSFQLLEIAQQSADIDPLIVTNSDAHAKPALENQASVFSITDASRNTYSNDLSGTSIPSNSQQTHRPSDYAYEYRSVKTCDSLTMKNAAIRDIHSVSWINQQGNKTLTLRLSALTFNVFIDMINCHPDCIVNFAHRTLTGANNDYMNKVIHITAGSNLEKENKEHFPKRFLNNRCKTGDTWHTKPYNIQNIQGIIHTILPEEIALTRNEMLSKCLFKSMKIAHEKGYKKVAIAPILPLHGRTEENVFFTLKALRATSLQYPEIEVLLCCNSTSDYHRFRNYMTYSNNIRPSSYSLIVHKDE